MNVEKIFPQLEEFYLYSCPGFTHKDLLALAPGNVLYILTPMASMINEEINLLEMFPKLHRINLRCLLNISLPILLKWLVNSNASQFEIIDQQFSGFTLADLILKLIGSRLDKSSKNMTPVCWIRLSLIHNLLPGHLLPELCDILTDEMPPLTLIVDVFDEESSEAWNLERDCVLKKNTSLDVIID